MKRSSEPEIGMWDRVAMRDAMTSGRTMPPEMRVARVAQLSELYAKLAPQEVSPFDTQEGDVNLFLEKFKGADTPH
jgi:hypothetical protein